MVHDVGAHFGIVVRHFCHHELGAHAVDALHEHGIFVALCNVGDIKKCAKRADALEDVRRMCCLHDIFYLADNFVACLDVHPSGGVGVVGHIISVRRDTPSRRASEAFRSWY